MIILTVNTTDATTYTVTFSAAVAVDLAATPDDGLDVGGDPPDQVLTAVGATVTLKFGDGAAAGHPWTLSAQPNWLLTPIDFPQAGTTS